MNLEKEVKQQEEEIKNLESLMKQAAEEAKLKLDTKKQKYNSKIIALKEI